MPSESWAFFCAVDDVGAPSTAVADEVEARRRGAVVRKTLHRVDDDVGRILFFSFSFWKEPCF